MISYILSFSFSCSLFACFIVWSRLFFLVDVLAHSSVLAIGLSSFFQIPLPFCLFGTFLSVSSFVYLKKGEHKDARLPLVSYSCLGLGILLNFLVKDPTLSYQSLFVGDLLLTTYKDAIPLAAIFITTLLFWKRHQKTILLIMLNEELAIIENLPTRLVKTASVVLLILFLSLALESMGALLCPGLLIIPPLTARLHTSSVKSMGILTCAITILCMISGVELALLLDYPTSPCILLCASFCYVVMRFVPRELLGFYFQTSS